MSQTATQEDVQKLGHNLRDEIRENTRDIIGYFNKSQGQQNERLDRIEQKVDVATGDVSKIKLAVVDLLAIDRHPHNLVQELKSQNIVIDGVRFS